MQARQRIAPRFALVASASLALALLFSSREALAGSYLDRAGLLLGQANAEADYLRGRLSDRELARMIHALAGARVKAATTMTVPKEVAQAHPHLLLVLENFERAADAARGGETQRFLVYQLRARDEERVFRGILKQLGWPLPGSQAAPAASPRDAAYRSPRSPGLGAGPSRARCRGKTPGRWRAATSPNALTST